MRGWVELVRALTVVAVAVVSMVVVMAVVMVLAQSLRWPRT